MKMSSSLAKSANSSVKFRYTKPDTVRTKRGITALVRSDILLGAVQVFTAGGGERNLHSHDALDGFWFVLRGAARFYGEHDEVTGELSAHEGMFIPRGVPYWFEQIGEEPLEILQVEAQDLSVPNRVKLYRSPEKVAISRFDMEGNLLAEDIVDPSSHTQVSTL